MTQPLSAVEVDQALPSLEIPITRTLIVSGAIASRDFQDVHHDAVAAVEKGTDDIFMNILTSNGLVGRFVTDWAGSRTRLSRISIRLGAPNMPGDTMVLSGEVAHIDRDERVVTVNIRGTNSRGTHVSGEVDAVWL